MKVCMIFLHCVILILVSGCRGQSQKVRLPLSRPALRMRPGRVVCVEAVSVELGA